MSRDAGPCCFVSDLHGDLQRYRKLFDAIGATRPDAVFLGGDLLPHGYGIAGRGERGRDDFARDVLGAGFRRIRDRLGDASPQVHVILGNDDLRVEEPAVMDAAAADLWHYAHNRRVMLGRRPVYGYALVPPTPFRLKDWERYDVSRYVDPGCVSPEDGMRSVEVSRSEIRYGTIAGDLDRLIGDDAVDDGIFLFHAPPYRTALDRAALDGKMIDHVPLDVHVGSIAIRRMIERRQPLLTLHGHIHESARLTGSWRDRIGRTHLFGAAHDGPELSVVWFDPDDLDAARRELL